MNATGTKGRAVMTIWPKGKPQPKGSVSAFYDKARHQMRRFDSNRGGKAWADEVRRAAVDAIGEVEDGMYPIYGAGTPLAVSVSFFLPRPKKPKWKDSPLGKPDLDKLLRGLLDPLKGIVFADDAQVVTIYADKRWASPGMEGAVCSVLPVGLHASAHAGMLDPYAEAEGAIGI